MLRIIAVGKKHESWAREGLERYQTRLVGIWQTEWLLLPHSAREGQEARREESAAILARLDTRDYVILLDERGRMLDSPHLSRLLTERLETAQRIVFVIGGAYGVDEALRARADVIWSLSPLVFPHQLVRLILIEQLYRAQSIAARHPYHHE